MKCTKETEDKLRKVVCTVLCLITVAGVIFAAIEFTQGFIFFTTAVIGAVALLLVLFLVVIGIEWCLGEISFCKGENR